MALHDRRTPFGHLRRSARAVRDEVDEEIRGHLEMRVDELVSAGLSRDDARREALRRFGNIESAREYCRREDELKESAMHRALILQDLRQDFHVSARTLLRAPLLTLTILIIVGLGIGATTVMVGAIDVAFLRPLPYPDAARLEWIYRDAPPFEFRFSVVDYLAIESQQTRFDRVAAFTGRAMTFSDGTSADLLEGREVSWSYFRTVGIRPSMGRDFEEKDGVPGSPRMAIVSHSLWQQRLGGRADAIGRPIRLDGLDYVLAGVLPPRVGPLEHRQDFFIAAQFSAPSRRGPFLYWMVGRLKPGVERSVAIEELQAINRRIFPLWKSSYQDEKSTWKVVDLRDRLVRRSRSTAAIALSAAAFVWLIACMNASNLLVARVTGRRRELAVRAALGASRARVIRLLLVESSLLAAGAAAIGAALTPPGIALVRRVGGAYLPRTQELAVDAPLLGVLATIALVSFVVVAFLPALHAFAGPLGNSLRSEGYTTTGNRATQRLRRALVSGQFAISTPLLIASALLLITLNELKRVDIGFSERQLLTASVRLPAERYKEDASVVALWDELARRLSGVAGVTGVAFTDTLPPDGASNINNFELEGLLPEQARAATPWAAVSPGYFRVLGLSLLEGRLLDEHDARTEYLESVVVDRAWARRFFPGRSALGRRFKEGGCSTCPWTTVVGVVSDVRYTGLSQPDEGTVYWPLSGGSSRSVVLKTAGDPHLVLPQVRQVLHAVEPAAPLTDIATIDDLVAQSLDAPGSLSWLVAAFALVAVLLSLVGIYGVMAHFVQQNRKDISVRLALGGSAAAVERHVVGHGVSAVGAGIAIGVVIALAGTRVMANLLFGVTAIHLPTFMGVSLALLATALVACAVPARRAANLEPAAVLRDE
jgi:putative ABC transport system permease protein